MREEQLDRQRIRRRRKRRRRRRRRLFFRTLFSLLFFGTLLLGGIRIFSRITLSGPQVSDLSYTAVETEPHIDHIDLAQLNLNSPCAILTDAETGEILGEYNGQEQIYPASLTKIMTALLAIEHTSDFSETVTVPGSIFPDLYAQNASMAGFQPGETASLEDLLYGVLLPSGAECSLTFALQIAGSEEAFVGLMNEKAAALGMEHTHFANATGLHDPEHYSTVHDLSLLLRFCLQDETFRTVFTTFCHSTAPSAQHPDGFTFFSTLSPDLEEGVFSGGEILGGKTGYTQEAGLCLASLAQIQGREYLLVTAGAPGDHQSDPLHVRDAAEVYGQLALSLER